MPPKQAPPALNAFEAARAERIARNAAQLAELGVAHAAASLQPAVVRKPRSQAAAPRRVDAAPAAVRTSKRVRLRSGDAMPEEAEEVEHADAPATPQDPGRLLSCDEYLVLAKLSAGALHHNFPPLHTRRAFPHAPRAPHAAGPLMTGHFTGWVEEGVRAKLGIAEDAAAAWAAGGGGSFDRRAPKGESAKEFARAQLRKNPNAYFYRHNTPGEDTWQGEWSEEEVALFVQVALRHGAGDKWGLFASHIPHRVGYQCSAAYRHIVLPRGLLRDDHFKFTASGEAVWNSKGRKRSRGEEED